MLTLLLGLACHVYGQSLPNPSFETPDATGAKPLGWAARPGDMPVSLRNDGGHDGARYLRFTDDRADGATFVECTRLPARAGST